MDDDGCTLPITTIQQSIGEIRDGICQDAPDCSDSIVDPVACDFTPWAKARCPVTCQVCTELGIRNDGDDDKVMKCSTLCYRNILSYFKSSFSDITIHFMIPDVL